MMRGARVKVSISRVLVSRRVKIYIEPGGGSQHYLVKNGGDRIKFSRDDKPMIEHNVQRIMCILFPFGHCQAFNAHT